MSYQRVQHQRERQRVRERSLGVLALMVLVSFAVVAGAIIAYYFVPNPDLFIKNAEKTAPSASLVRLTIEDGELLVPNYYIARVKRRPLGSVERVDLQVPWPFTGAAPKSRPEDATDFNDVLLITYEARVEALPEQDRLDNIYRYYIGGRPGDGPGGLKRYSFGFDTPYSDIELYIGELGGQQVHVRCDLKKSSLGPKLCERIVRVSNGTEIRYRFSRAHLGDWREIDATVQRLNGNIFNRDASS